MKGLDVQLTVDMIRLSDSCDRIVLLSGDADLMPSVAAVVNRGARVELLAFPTMLAKRLREAPTAIVDLTSILPDFSAELPRRSTVSQDEAKLWSLKGVAPEHRKDARATWSGVLLERALRALCQSHGLPVSEEDGLDALKRPQ